MPLRFSQMSLKALFVFESDGLAHQLCALGALELRDYLVGFVRCLFFRVSIYILQYMILYATLGATIRFVPALASIKASCG